MGIGVSRVCVRAASPPLPTLLKLGGKCRWVRAQCGFSHLDTVRPLLKLHPNLSAISDLPTQVSVAGPGVFRCALGHE